jgi:hypothetical protein
VYLATQCTVLESNADMQKRGQGSPDDGDAPALTFAAVVTLAEVEEEETHCVARYVLESKAEMQKCGHANPDDGDALAQTFAQPVAGGSRRRERQDGIRGRAIPAC